MSLILERSGATVSTTHSYLEGYAERHGGSAQVFRLFRNRDLKEVPMAVAVETIGIPLEAKGLDDVFERAMQGYVGAMRAVNRADSSDPADAMLFLQSGHTEDFERAFMVARSQPDVEVLGHPVNRQDFAHLVNYVMTNTCLDGGALAAEGHDPRLALVEQFRAGV